MNEQLLEKVKAQVPASPGVYQMFDASGEIIYVGKAKNLKNRMKSYFDSSEKSAKTYALVSKISDFKYILTNSEQDAFSLECNLIKEHKPKYNILLKDDKSFPYIKIDMNEKYPRLQVARRPKHEKNVLLFGPFVTGTRIGELLKIIKSAYPVRWCNTNFSGKPLRKTPCVHGEIGTCVAPCISAENEAKYMEMIYKIIEFLGGKTGDIKRQLERKMNEFSKELKFEEALETRNQLSSVKNMEKEIITSLSQEKNLDAFAISEVDETYCVNLMMIRGGKNVGQVNFPVENAVGERQELLTQFVSNYYNSAAIPKEIILKDVSDASAAMLEAHLRQRFLVAVKVSVPKIGIKKELLGNCSKNAIDFLKRSGQRLRRRQEMTTLAQENLKELLKLPKLDRIEGYDISNISGEFSVASMVVFKGGEPCYKDYRKFKIKAVVGADDFASMEEVLSRRIAALAENKSGFGEAPDLILIDGGFGQLHAAAEALSRAGYEVPIISLAKRDEEICTLHSKEPIKLDKSDYSLRLLQRVRDESHRFAITYHRNLRSKSLKSSLSEIEGLGEKKINALLKEFRSVEAIREASARDLAHAEGIGPSLAKKILEHFHG